MEDYGHWDHYVEYFDPRSGIGCRERVLGMGTALALAEIKRQLGFVRVQIIHRRFTRKKERRSLVVGF